MILACSVCYGAADPLVTRSMNAGVIVLAGIVVGLLAVIGFTAFQWARRAR